jgi:hypothetical protein
VIMLQSKIKEKTVYKHHKTNKNRRRLGGLEMDEQSDVAMLRTLLKTDISIT